jgi:hypothetical protein
MAYPLVISAILAVISLVFFVAAARAWSRAERGAATGAEDAASGRQSVRGELVLLLSSLGLLGVLWVAIAGLRLDGGRVLWVGLGLFLAALTITRPWWFWENYKARWTRRLLGDELTAFIYLVVAATMVWAGLFTDWTFGGR